MTERFTRKVTAVCEYICDECKKVPVQHSFVKLSNGDTKVLTTDNGMILHTCPNCKKQVGLLEKFPTIKFMDEDKLVAIEKKQKEELEKKNNKVVPIRKDKDKE